MRALASRASFLAAAILSACSHQQSALAPDGGTARAIYQLFWFFTGVCMAVWLVVMAFMLAAIFRWRGSSPDPMLEPEDASERRISWVVGAGVALTVLILTIFTFASFLTNKSFAEPRPRSVTIKITGHQWWWQVNYEAHRADQTFETANEIHIPVGQPVKLDFESPDVIHSFWVPSLSGKQDLIPGRYTTLTIEADKAGIYRGQCAEFCGIQHAHMAMYVVAQAPREFAQWRVQQLQSATPPHTNQLRRGQQVFQASACAMCHSISGTNAGGRVGPDLTHFGSRMSIASGTAPNTLGNLTGWIADPQRMKPYTRMPSVALTGPDLIAVSQYLESLK
ncbi:MAG: cytochrome c oxidase subunit II [Alphaproteobacteria bacterium]|nr:cytochrome c oxidase subunit II [Alphaproteobacteria bacterium]